MHSKSNNTKFMSFDNANEIVTELFESLLSRYQTDLKKSMRGSDFFFDSVQLLYSKDDTCFQYAVAVALNYEEIKSHP